MSGVIPSTLKKNNVSISNRFPEVRKRGIHTHTHTHTQTDRHTHTQTDRQTERQTDRQTDRQTETDRVKHI